MLAISDQFQAATTDAARSTAFAAAQAVVASFTGTAYHASYLIGSVVLVAISVPMIRSPIFGRAVAWLGIISNLVALGLYLPVVGIGFAVLSVFGLEAWYILVGRQLHLAASRPVTAARGHRLPV